MQVCWGLFNLCKSFCSI